MLKFYNLPGRVIAEFQYLWPKSGQQLSSGRRRKHPLVHFAYSTAFYATLLFALAVVLNRTPPS